MGTGSARRRTGAQTRAARRGLASARSRHEAAEAVTEEDAQTGRRFDEAASSATSSGIRRSEARPRGLGVSCPRMSMATVAIPRSAHASATSRTGACPHTRGAGRRRLRWPSEVTLKYSIGRPSSESQLALLTAHAHTLLVSPDPGRRESSGRTRPQSRARHVLGRSPRLGAGDGGLVDDPAAADDHDAVGEGEDLVESALESRTATRGFAPRGVRADERDAEKSRARSTGSRPRGARLP